MAEPVPARAERWLQALSPIALLALWETAVRLGALDARFFPPPTAVAAAFLETLRTGELLRAVEASLLRVAAGFAAGAAPALLIGLTMGLVPAVRAVLEPIVYALYPIPKLALLPLIMLICGLGEASKIVTIGLGVFFIVLINTAAGVVNIDRVYVDVARSFGARRLDFYLTIALPGALPSICTGIRLGAGMALLLIVAAEMIAAESGIGYMIWSSYQAFQLEKMYLAFALIAALGWLMSLVLDRMERTVIPWKPPENRE